MEKYKIVGEIGKGSFGRVFRAVNNVTKKEVALKKLSCDAPENIELALQEFQTLSRLQKHLNVVRFKECSLQHKRGVEVISHGEKKSEGYLYLVEKSIKGECAHRRQSFHLWFVMELCDGGDLNHFVLALRPSPHLNAACIRQLADGVAFLHDNCVVHRDLKPENILIKKHGNKENTPVLKIADFGLSKVCSPREDSGKPGSVWMSSACGSDFFMAPEVFEGRYNAKADVFALGIIFWSVIDRITFIDADTKKVLLGTYVRRGPEVLPVGEALLSDPALDLHRVLTESSQKRSEWGGAVSRTCVAANKPRLRKLIAELIQPNCELRPSSKELVAKLSKILRYSATKLKNEILNGKVKPPTAVLEKSPKIHKMNPRKEKVKLLEGLKPTNENMVRVSHRLALKKAVKISISEATLNETDNKTCSVLKKKEVQKNKVISAKVPRKTFETRKEKQGLEVVVKNSVRFSNRLAQKKYLKARKDLRSSERLKQAFLKTNIKLDPVTSNNECKPAVDSEFTTKTLPETTKPVAGSNPKNTATRCKTSENAVEIEDKRSKKVKKPPPVVCKARNSTSGSEVENEITDTQVKQQSTDITPKQLKSNTLRSTDPPSKSSDCSQPVKRKAPASNRPPAKKPKLTPPLTPFNPSGGVYLYNLLPPTRTGRNPPFYPRLRGNSGAFPYNYPLCFHFTRRALSHDLTPETPNFTQNNYRTRNMVASP